MQHEPNEMQPSRDQRLTDFLCGELDPAAARELEAELARDPALQARLAELRRTFDLVRADAPALTAGLPPERRASLRAAAAATASAAASTALLASASRDGQADDAAAPSPASASRVLRMPVWLRAAAALLLVVGGVFLWRTTRPDSILSDEGLTAELEDRHRLESLGYVDAPSSSPNGAPAQTALQEQALSALGYAGSLSDGAALRIAPAPAAELGAFLSKHAESDLFNEDAQLDALEVREPFVGFSSVTPPPASTLALDTGGGGGRSGPGKPNPAAPSTPGFSAPADSVPDSESRYLGRGGLEEEEAEESRKSGEQLAQLGYGDGDMGELAKEAKDKSLLELTDGYGRNYRATDVLTHLRRHGNETPRDMFFRYYGDNATVRAKDDPLSTFAADVDTASYALVRNYLRQGHIPPKAAVRTEEFVNSFEQELAPPAEGDFAIHLEAAPTPYGVEGSVLLRCGIKAREVSRAERKSLNLIFVVDKSGSMADGNRLALVQNSLELLVDQIRDDDTIGLVAFDSEGHAILAPTPGAERWKIREALRGLTSGGSTNAAEGLFMGYKMAEGSFRKNAVNRVVIASDGVANTGETDQQRILVKVKQGAEADIDLTSIGVGMGNHNDAFLERLADEGEGSCHYVDDLDEAKRVLVDGFTGTMQVVAREVKIQVEFDPAVVSSWRQLGYENRALRHQDFRNDQVDAGEVGAGHEVVALYELQLTPEQEGSAKLATLRLRWKPDGGRDFREIETVLRQSETRSRWGLASPRLRLAGTVAQFAEFLRRSVHARGDFYDTLLQEASRLARELGKDAQVAEFRDLVDRAGSLVRQLWPEDDLALLIEEARRARLLETELECVRERTPQVEELLKEARLNNAELERRLQDLLQPR